MNKYKLLAIALLIGTLSLFANDKRPNVSKDEIVKQIIELVQVAQPTFANNTTINLTLTFSSEGEIVVLDIDSKNKEVIKFVLDNINYKKIENPGKRDKRYTINLPLAG